MSTLLSILTVSNNRRTTLEEQVVNLLTLLNGQQEGRFEVIISETSSSHLIKSEKLASIHCPQNVQYSYIFQPLPFATAEEHLLARIDMPCGEYCWILGDDDPVVPDGLSRLVLALNKSLADFILFDSYPLSSDGLRFGDSRRNHFPNGRTIMTMDELISLYGFWFVPSGFSIIVFRRSLFNALVYRAHVAISPIYSHVSAFIECFSDATCAVVGAALVWYRTNSSDEGDDDNWERLARSKKHSKNYPWTLGFSALLARLVAKRLLRVDSIRFAIDQNHCSRFVWHMLAMEMILSQCRSDIERLSESSSSMTLFIDSIRRPEMSWSEFMCFWSLVLRDTPINDSFTKLLGIYKDIVLTTMVLEKLKGAPIALALDNRIRRLNDRFKNYFTLVYDTYLAKYMHFPVRYWIDQGPLSVLTQDAFMSTDEVVFSRDMIRLAQALRAFNAAKHDKETIENHAYLRENAPVMPLS